MAKMVVSAAVGSLLVLMALLTAVHKCQCTCSDTTNTDRVIPDSYKIHTAAVYEDPACDPPSTSARVTPNSQVTCPPRQATGATPRLTDGVLGPDNLTSTTTDYAYTLAGPSQFGLFETWITFDFTSRVSLASVTLHYYCTEQSPQLRLYDGSGVVTPPVSPQCDSTAQRQCLTINVSTSTTVVNLEVLRNGNTIYISEVKLFKEPSSNTMGVPTATPSINSSILSTLKLAPYSTIITAMATSTSPPSSTDNSSAVAGAVAGVVAGLVVCIAGAVLLIIACFIFKRRISMQMKLLNDGGQSRLENNYTAEGFTINASPEHLKETYTELHNPRYTTGQDNEPTDSHNTAVDDPHYDAASKDSRASPSTGQSNHPASPAVYHEISPAVYHEISPAVYVEISPAVYHEISPAVYHEIETGTDTYTVPLSPDTDTYTVPVDAMNLIHQPLAHRSTNSLERSASFGTQNAEIDTASDSDHTYSAVGQKATEPGRLAPGTSGNGCTFSEAVPVRSTSYKKRHGSKKVPPKDISKDTANVNAQTQKDRQEEDRAAMDIKGGDSEKSAATAGQVYAVIDKKRKEEDRSMAASKKTEVELGKSAVTAGAVYTVLEIAPPSSHQPGD